MRAGELPAILGGYDAAAIVYAPRDNRITGVEIILRFYIDNQADLLLRSGDDRTKPDIIGDASLPYRFILCVHTADDTAALVRQHGDF